MPINPALQTIPLKDAYLDLYQVPDTPADIYTHSHLWDCCVSDPDLPCCCGLDLCYCLPPPPNAGVDLERCEGTEVLTRAFEYHMLWNTSDCLNLKVS